jgi:hypothetical protein
MGFISCEPHDPCDLRNNKRTRKQEKVVNSGEAHRSGQLAETDRLAGC